MFDEMIAGIREETVKDSPAGSIPQAKRTNATGSAKA